MSAGVSRRGAVIGAGCVVAAALLGGTSKAFAGEGALLRPPGGQDESALIGACLRCDRCRSACPQNAIGVALLEQGLINARTPVLNFRRGWCDMCSDRGSMRCVEVCATGALSREFDPSTGKIGVAVVDEDECLLSRAGSHVCSKQCIESCNYDAISLTEEGRLVVDVEKCNGCGACEFYCPSASYGSFTGSNRRGINVEPRKE